MKSVRPQDSEAPGPAEAAARAALRTSIWRLDLATGRICANAEGFAIAGCDPPEDAAAGHPIETVRSRIHPDDRARVEAAARAALEGGGVVDVKARYRQRDGSYRTLLTRRVAERDEHGRAVALVGLSLALGDLAALQGDDRARANRLFLAHISHEMRTPLNAVLGFAQLLLHDNERPLDPRQRSRVGHIHDSGTHLLRLVDEALDLASLESGSLALADQVVHLGRVVNLALARVEPHAARADVLIERGEIHGAVRGDEARVLQVLLQLLSNGVKYNLPGGTVALAQLDDARLGRIGLQVSDNGRGLTAEQRGRLFEPFDRLGAERERIEGAGLGLALARGLVERMGGEIAVASAPGRGSTFCVWLRAASAADIVRDSGASDSSFRS